MREAEIVQLIEKLKEQIDSQLAPVHGSRQRWAANELIDYIRDEYCESDSSTRPPRAQEFRYRKLARDTTTTPTLPPDLEEGAEELDEIVLRAVNFLHTEVMSDHEIWMGVDTPAWHLTVWFYATVAGTIRYRVESDPKVAVAE